MKNYNVSEHQSMGHMLLLACVTALVVAFTVLLPQPAYADEITPPPLPAGLAPVPAGNKLYLGTHAVGTQNYVCKPSGAGVAYVLFTPEATLFGEDGGQAITHDFSPNPFSMWLDPRMDRPVATS
jgi:hypothetical protein